MNIKRNLLFTTILLFLFMSMVFSLLPVSANDMSLLVPESIESIYNEMHYASRSIAGPVPIDRSSNLSTIEVENMLEIASSMPEPMPGAMFVYYFNIFVANLAILEFLRGGECCYNFEICSNAMCLVTAAVGYAIAAYVKWEFANPPTSTTTTTTMYVSDKIIFELYACTVIKTRQAQYQPYYAYNCPDKQIDYTWREQSWFMLPLCYASQAPPEDKNEILEQLIHSDYLYNEDEFDNADLSCECLGQKNVEIDDEDAGWLYYFQGDTAFDLSYSLFSNLFFIDYRDYIYRPCFEHIEGLSLHCKYMVDTSCDGPCSTPHWYDFTEAYYSCEGCSNNMNDINLVPQECYEEFAFSDELPRSKFRH